MEVLKKAEVRRSLASAGAASSVEKTYERLVEFVMRLMRKRTTTDNFELMQFGKQLLGEKFAGVYSSDQRPALSKNKPYAILNTKPMSSGGEYWIGLARIPTTGKVMHYDSFGRSHRQLFPDRWKDAVNTDLDAEQDDRKTECGQRSLAWLLLFDKLGPSAAKII